MTTVEALTTSTPQNVVALAIARLPELWKNKPIVVGTLTAFVSPMQDIENALMQLLTLRDLNTAEGTQLDQIGDIVNQPRAGQNDATYVLYLRAKIAADISAGTTEQLINIASLILNDATYTIAVLTEGIATVTVNIYGSNVPASGVPQAILAFEKLAVKAGVRVIVTYENASDSQTFYTARAAFPTSALTAGQNSIQVNSTANFPTTGQLYINYGLPDFEMVSYVGTDPTHFLLGLGQLAQNHPSGASCKLVGSTGLGLGTTTNGTIGGVFASAIA